MAGNDNIPVDIEFVFKNLNVDQEASNIKKEIIDVGATTDKVSEQVEANFTEAFTKASAEAAKMNSSFRAGSTGVNQLTKSNNQLSYSIQQVARELPNIAISPQLFIMAISNNLPILQDQLRRTRLENEALKASGATTVPVFKQVISSIFSWQTALIAIITVFTVFGKDIFDAVGRLVSFRNEVGLTKKEVNDLTDSLAKNIGSELGKMDRLFNTLEKAKEGTVQYAGAKKEIIDQYGTYLSGLDDEITSLQNMEGAYRAVTEAIIEQSKAKALDKVYQEQFQNLSQVIIDQLPVIQKLLKDKWGDGIGQFYYEQLIKELEAGKGFSYEIQRIIDDFTTTETRFIAGGQFGGAQQITVVENKLKDAIGSISDAQDDYNNKVKEADSLLGSLLATGQENGKRTIDTINDEIEALKKEQGLFSSSSDEYKKYQNQIDALVKERAAITGEKTGDNNYDEYVAQLKEKEQAYLDYNAALRQHGINWAKENFEILLKDGASWRDYLEKQVEEFRDSRDRMVAIAIAAQNSGITLFPQELTLQKPRKGNITSTSQPGIKQLADLSAFYERLEVRLIKLKKAIANDDIEKMSKGFYDTSEILGAMSYTLGQFNSDLGDTIVGMADVAYNASVMVKNLAEGGNIATAIASGIGILGNIFNIFKSDDTSEVVERQIQEVSKLYSTMSALLNQLSGSDFFAAAKNDIKELNKDLDYNWQRLQSLQQIPVWNGNNFDQIDTSSYTLTQWTELLKKLEDIPLYADSNWYADAYQYVQNILDLNDKLSETTDTMYQELLGFTSDDLATSILDGIQNGLKLSEGSLGDWTNTFGDFLKQALYRNLTETITTSLLTDFMQTFTDAMGDSMLTDDEIMALQETFASSIEESEKAYAAIAPILEKYTNVGNEKGLTGAIQGITEETASLIAGQFTAMRIDLKGILNAIVQDDDIVQQRLAYLKNIASNTSYNKELVTIRDDIKSMNKILENRL